MIIHRSQLEPKNWTPCSAVTKTGKPCKNKGRAHRRFLCDSHWKAKANPDRNTRPKKTSKEFFPRVNKWENLPKYIRQQLLNEASRV